MSTFLNDSPDFLGDNGTSPLSGGSVIDSFFDRLPTDLANEVVGLDFKRQRVLIAYLFDYSSLFEHQDFYEVRDHISKLLCLFDLVDTEGDRNSWKKLLKTDVLDEYPIVVCAGLYHRLVNPTTSFEEIKEFMDAFEGKVDFTPFVTAAATHFIEEGDLLSAYDLIDYFKVSIGIEVVRGALKKQEGVLHATHKGDIDRLKGVLEQL